MIRKVIKIDENKCNGCGICVGACAEGAIQIIDGKARLINEVFCDGLGACVGECPVGAITIEEREGYEYDEIETLKENIIPKGDETVIKHFVHLKTHGADMYYNEGINYLKDNGFSYIVDKIEKELNMPCFNFNFSNDKKSCDNSNIFTNYKLSNWPIQLQLVPTHIFSGQDIVIAADCSAFSSRIVEKYINAKKLIIACPKLDKVIDFYINKLSDIIKRGVNTITVLRMEVPCCYGLVRIVEEAIILSGKKVPLKEIVISISGEVLKEEWVGI